MASSRLVKLIFTALVLLSVFLMVFVAYQSYQRVIYPHELSKMEGCFADHVRRVAEGRPIYTQPSAGWVPFLYMPLNHYLGGWICRLGVNGLLAGRLLSVLSIVCSALVGMWMVSRATRRSPLVAIIPALIAATYFDVRGFYDQSRTDGLMTLLCLLSVAGLMLKSKALGVTLFSIFAALAFFTKQSVFVFYGPFLVVLFCARWRLAIVCGLCAVVVTVAAYFVADGATDGWLGTYAFKSAASHDLDHRRLIDWVATDFLGKLSVPTIAVVLSAFLFLVDRFGRTTQRSAEDDSFALMLALAVGALGFSVASSWQHLAVRNVLVIYAAVGMIFLPVALQRILDYFRDSPFANTSKSLVGVLLCLLVARGFQNPAPYVPQREDYQAWQDIRESLLSYGDPERAWVTLHGSVWGSQPGDIMHVHMAPLSDAVGGYFGEKTGLAIPDDLIERIESQWYSVIVLGFWDDRVKNLIKDHYEPDTNQPQCRFPAFSGYAAGREEFWIPKTQDR